MSPYTSKPLDIIRGIWQYPPIYVRKFLTAIFWHAVCSAGAILLFAMSARVGHAVERNPDTLQGIERIEQFATWGVLVALTVYIFVELAGMIRNALKENEFIGSKIFAT